MKGLGAELLVETDLGEAEEVVADEVAELSTVKEGGVSYRTVLRSMTMTYADSASPSRAKASSSPATPGPGSTPSS